jgi:hypothetical protein
MDVSLKNTQITEKVHNLVLAKNIRNTRVFDIGIRIIILF